MSIGSCSASPNRSTKPSVRLTYFFSGSHVKQLLTTFVAVPLAAILFLPVFAADARAGALKRVYERAGPEDFFDWQYAQKVWFEMRTHEAEMAEYNKYRDVFEPWRVAFQQRGVNFLRGYRKDIDAHPEPKRSILRRGFDVQLAYDVFFDHVYMDWFKDYPAQAMAGTAQTFDQLLAERSKRPACVPQQRLDECGPVPDWRDADDRAKEREMMRQADEAAAKARRKR